MKAFITGATGFVGAHVARMLLAEGSEVRALVREKADTRNIDGLELERVTGDLLDEESLKKGMEGCEAVFHVAAHYSLWERERELIFRANVEGTRKVMAAAKAAGVGRIVYTSSVAAIKPPADPAVPADETSEYGERVPVSSYKQSKLAAEREVLKLAAEGLPVVIVNPSAPIGARDIKPTPTGRIVLDFIRGKMPAYLDTGMNIVDVEDVARGHLLARDKGRVGARYILGNSNGNLSLRESFGLRAKVSGVPAPKWKLPYAVAYLAGAVSELVSRITGKPPGVPLVAVKMSKHPMFYTAAKAVRELGLPQTPPEEAFRKAVEWFRAEGYVKK